MFSKEKRDRLQGYPAILCLIMILLPLGCANPGDDRDLIVIRGHTMGTGYTVKIVNKPRMSQEDIGNAEEGIDSLLRTVNQQMSTYIDSSEISRFNLHRGIGWFSISTELAEIIAQSLEVSEKSGGAFDITVGPLVNLWGFGPSEREADIPGRERIRQVMQRTGYRKVSVRLAPPSVRKENPEVYCDLAAIAKGHGTDRIAGYLDSVGVSDYVIEMGGEIRAKGRNHLNNLWQIGIADPDNGLGIQRVVSLSNTSMATSGDYRNYFEHGGTRYSHIIDPRTGEPVTHKLASVTVIHENCAYADAMATAIIVLGPEDGYELALEENLPALLIVRERDSLIEKVTPSFKRHLESYDYGSNL